MNSFVKTKMDKSQKEEEDRRESSFASETSADSKKKKTKVPWWYHHKKRSSIGFSLCYLCIHARVIIDYYYIRDRVCYRIQTTCALLFPLCATRLEIRLQNLFDFLRDRFWFTHGAYTRVATRECFFDRV